MKITVTQEHIDKGVRGDPYKCAIGLSLTEKGLGDCEVGYEIYISGQPFRVPDWVCKWGQDFDKGRYVEPIEFDLKGSY